MATWSNEELDRIGRAEELQLTSRRDDRSLRRYVTMWVVRTGDDVYVRSAGGPDRPWYRRAKASGAGRIRAGGVERDVTFAEATADAHASIEAAYHAKYDRYGATIVGHVTGPHAQPVTIRLMPKEREHGHQSNRANRRDGAGANRRNRLIARTRGCMTSQQ